MYTVFMQLSSYAPMQKLSVPPVTFLVSIGENIWYFNFNRVFSELSQFRGSDKTLKSELAYLIFTAGQTKLWESNVFSPVCLSVCPEVGSHMTVIHDAIGHLTI